MINFHHIDCMEFMKGVPDEHYDLAIVDPPYGIARFGNRVELSNRLYKSAKLNEWDIKPNDNYFKELFRVSKNQIVWGANNFIMPPSEYFCIWNKKQTVENFASAEYAWVSIGLKKPARVFDYSIHKTMSDRKEAGGKIHPTQKPVALYEWLLMNYAKEGDKILDTHGGSASIALACHNLKFDLDICEIDRDYFDASKKRYEQHISQIRMF